MSQIITKRLAEIKKLEDDAKGVQEMITEVLETDSEVVAYDDKLQEAKRNYNLVKEALLNEPENRKLTERLKELKGELKEAKELLSSDLLGYFSETGSLLFTTEEGKQLQINFKGKVV